MARSRPYIILNAAISLDGKIATKKGESQLSSHTDKVRVHKLRSNVDAILVGKNTVQRDNPHLTVRHAKGKNPVRIILDSKAVISTKSKIIKTCNKVPTIIAVSKLAPKKNLEKLQKHPLRIIVIGKKKIDLKNLLQYLTKLNIKKILVEGGGTVNWQFINQNLFDEVIVTVTPFVIGGTDATSLVGGSGFSKINNCTKLKLKKISRSKNEVVLYYTKSK